jgi:phosphoribosylaminoimidazole-succinocarboxamide synthase
LGADYAATHGIILADTKFEFGLLPMTAYRGKLEARLILIDEVLTPDSSRYWPTESYSPGRSQPSFDKQYLRDWLRGEGFKKGFERGPQGGDDQGWTMSEEVVKVTAAKYEHARDILTRDEK